MSCAAMNKQVRRPGPKCLWTCCVHSLHHQNCHICHHISCFWLCHSSPARSAKQQDPSQEPSQDGPAAGIAGVGRGQWLESGLNSSISFPGGGHCLRHTCVVSTARHSIFREQIIILSARPLKPPQSSYSLSQC